MAMMDEQSQVVEIHHNLGIETGSTTAKNLEINDRGHVIRLPSCWYSSEGVRSSAGI